MQSKMLGKPSEMLLKCLWNTNKYGMKCKLAETANYALEQETGLEIYENNDSGQKIDSNVICLSILTEKVDARHIKKPPFYLRKTFICDASASFGPVHT